jgi:hypothetical protein
MPTQHACSPSVAIPRRPTGRRKRHAWPHPSTPGTTPATNLPSPSVSSHPAQPPHEIAPNAEQAGEPGFPRMADPRRTVSPGRCRSRPKAVISRMNVGRAGRLPRCGAALVRGPRRSVCGRVLSGRWWPQPGYLPYTRSSGMIGRWRMRPVAWKTALAVAGGADEG